MQFLAKIRNPRRKISAQRKYLMVATLEGFPAVIILQLLGGPFLTGYLLYLGATSTEIGFVLAITTVVNVVQILMAIVMQKFSNRKLMLVFSKTTYFLKRSYFWRHGFSCRESQCRYFHTSC
ncbi:hypothetical protein [Paenibacillus sp. SI8]|uniref:hypothetical protein n=1 Tax=unclassified Paenibacillus TaxID=185978 RepID=UPI0034650068